LQRGSARIFCAAVPGPAADATARPRVGLALRVGRWRRRRRERIAVASGNNRDAARVAPSKLVADAELAEYNGYSDLAAGLEGPHSLAASSARPLAGSCIGSSEAHLIGPPA